MPTLDIFNDDAFSVVSLTAAINDRTEGENVPSLLDPLFEEEGITTTTVSIERMGDAISLVESKERGAPGQVVVGDKRTFIPFQTVHLPQQSAIRADEVQGIRAFGSESDVQVIENLVRQRQAKLRRQLDATLAYHKLGALKGQVLDSDGSTVLLDIFSAFGLTQQTHSLELDVDTTDVRVEAVKAMRKAEKALGFSALVTGWRAFVGEGFFDALISHPDVKNAYDRWQDGAALRNDLRGGFVFANIEWVEYYGKVGGVEFIDTDTGYLVPMGVPELFIARYAPADYMETVNTLGLPYYSRIEPMRWNKGVELEAQSNPLHLCTKPRAVIKLTKT